MEDPMSTASGDRAAICAAEGAIAAVAAPTVEVAGPTAMKQPASRVSIRANTAAAKIATGKTQLFERNAIDAVKLARWPL